MALGSDFLSGRSRIAVAVGQPIDGGHLLGVLE